MDFLDEFLDLFVSVFNTIFDFVTYVFSSLLVPLFYRCDERGSSFLGYIDLALSYVTFSNFILFFIGFFITFSMIKLTIRFIQIIRG